MAASAIQRTKPLVFLKEVKTELSKVTWPTRRQTINLTLIVIGVSIVTAIFLGTFDVLFTKLIETLITL